MSITTCEQARRLLDQTWDGEALTSADASVLSQHLAGCESCAALEADMGAVLSGARALGEERYERARDMAPIIVRPRRTVWPFAVGVAASAVVMALVLFVGGPTADVGGDEELVVRLVVPLPDAQAVSVVGDFTGWRERIPLERSADGVWVGELKVKAGRYRYVVVVNGTALVPDPAARQVVDDGFGGQNSVLDVGI